MKKKKNKRKELTQERNNDLKEEKGCFSIINNNDNSKDLWDKETNHISSIIKVRKLKCLHIIFNKFGCKFIYTLLDNHRKNQFFEFIDNTNYVQCKNDASN